MNAQIRWNDLKDSPGLTGEWRGKLVRKRLGRNVWRVYQLKADPCRLYIPAVDLEYAYGTCLLSDGPSIPWFVCLMFGRGREDFLRDGFLHDFMYDVAGVYVRHPSDKEWQFVPMEKENADTVLRLGVRADGATLKQEKLIYWGVRTFIGERAWKKCRESGATECLQAECKFV